MTLTAVHAFPMAIAAAFATLALYSLFKRI